MVSNTLAELLGTVQGAERVVVTYGVGQVGSETPLDTHSVALSPVPENCGELVCQIFRLDRQLSGSNWSEFFDNGFTFGIIAINGTKVQGETRAEFTEWADPEYFDWKEAVIEIAMGLGSSQEEVDALCLISPEWYLHQALVRSSS